MTASTIDRVTSATGRAVAAADELFTAHGISAVPLSQVARRAGVPERMVRDAFPEKHDLAIRALEHRQQFWFDGMLAATANATDPRDEILAVFTYIEAARAVDGCAASAFRAGYSELGVDADAARLADEHLRRVEAHLTRLTARAGLPIHVGEGLALLVQGALVETTVHAATWPARSARLTAATLIAAYAPADCWF